MLARQLVQFRDLRFRFGEPVWIKIELIAITRDERVRFTELYRGGVEQFACGLQSRIEIGQARDLVLRPAEAAQRGEFAVAIQRFGQRGAALHERASIRQAFVRFVQCIEISRRERVAIEFGDLMFEQRDAFALILFATELANLRIDRRPFARGFRDFLAHCFIARKRVEQFELARFFEQRLMFVLAVDFDQMHGQRLQLRERCGPAVDPCARCSFAADHAPQLAVVAVVECLVDQPAPGAVGARQ